MCEFNLDEVKDKACIRSTSWFLPDVEEYIGVFSIDVNPSSGGESYNVLQEEVCYEGYEVGEISSPHFEYAEE